MPKGICYNASRQERRKCSLWHAKSPGGRNSGAFLFRCGKVAYSLGWLPPIYLRPAICRCSRRLHLPRQRVRKTKIYSWWHTPFLYLYRGGSVAHYTIVAEMPQEAISPCLLSKPYPFLCAGEADREYGRYQRTYPGTETDREQPQPNSKEV